MSGAMRWAVTAAAVCAVATGAWLMRPHRDAITTTKPSAAPNMSQGGESMERAEERRAWCVGRFEFMLPDEFVLAGRGQSIYRISVDTEALASGKTPQDLWRKRLSGVMPRGESKETPGRSMAASLPDVSSIWYNSNPRYPKDWTLLVMKPFQEHVVFMQVEAEAGREPVAEELVTMTLAAYTPGARYGFCVGDGAITSEMSRNEQAEATFHSTTNPGMEIRISTATVARPRDDHPMSDVEADREALAAQGEKLNVLRQGERTVAGLNGPEGWLALASPSEGLNLLFSWFYPGQSGRGDLPEILIKATAPGKHQASLEAAWEVMLGSMKRLPLTR